MADDNKCFSIGDTVSKVYSKTGLLRYGVVASPIKIVTTRKCVDIIWHPSGFLESVLVNKVRCL